METTERLKISSELLDNMLVCVKNQEDIWGKDGGVIIQLNKAILERILNAEMDGFSLGKYSNWAECWK